MMPSRLVSFLPVQQRSYEFRQIRGTVSYAAVSSDLAVPHRAHLCRCSHPEGTLLQWPSSQIREFTFHLSFPSFTTVGTQNPETQLASGFVSFTVICAVRVFYDTDGISGWIKNMVYRLVQIINWRGSGKGMWWLSRGIIPEYVWGDWGKARTLSRVR